MIFKCLTWNTAKRLKLLDDQFEFIVQTKPDIVALQEITLNTEQKFKELLHKKFKNVISSFDFVDDKNILKKNRMFGQLLATNYSVQSEEPKCFNIPWKERVLSAKIYVKEKKINFHTTHIPPGSSNGWIKIETLEGIYKRIQELKNELNILCGDFNTPKDENPKDKVITFAQTIDDFGVVKTKSKFRGGEGKRWDDGERNILVGLQKIGISDSFRKLYSYKKNDFSWEFKNKEKIIRRRFDHFFASNEIEVISAEYNHSNNKLSDHSPFIVKYKIS